MKNNYEVHQTSEGNLIKTWTKGVYFEEQALEQLKNTASLPFIFKHVAAMPDVHFGMGATIGSVIATKRAIIPAAVGVDIGCGMLAAKTSLTANDLPDSLFSLRNEIESQIPVGFNQYNDGSHLPDGMKRQFQFDTATLLENHDDFSKMVKDPFEKAIRQCGTLGGGNHFIELCLDENDDVWIMLHSGSRGIGNTIGRYFIEKAKEDMRIHHINLKDNNLSYLSEGTQHFDDYWKWLTWAQEYARLNREIMFSRVVGVIQDMFKDVTIEEHAINCHHNYTTRENHFGENVLITRKGAVSAKEGQLGIIPGSMGAKSFIVRGKGNKDSFQSCSHGAGRMMSRKKARATFTVDDHKTATEGVECKKGKSVLDETPGAYKDIDSVMNAQKDLVDIVHTLKQVLCVKG